MSFGAFAVIAPRIQPLGILNIAMEYVFYALIVLDIAATGFLWRRFANQPTMLSAALAEDERNDAQKLDAAMVELLERSRPSGGKVHIHDVEETMRRHLR